MGSDAVRKEEGDLALHSSSFFNGISSKISPFQKQMILSTDNAFVTENEL